MNVIDYTYLGSEFRLLERGINEHARILYIKKWCENRVLSAVKIVLFFCTSVFVFVFVFFKEGIHVLGAFYSEERKWKILGRQNQMESQKFPNLSWNQVVLLFQNKFGTSDWIHVPVFFNANVNGRGSPFCVLKQKTFFFVLTVLDKGIQCKVIGVPL